MRQTGVGSDDAVDVVGICNDFCRPAIRTDTFYNTAAVQPGKL